MVFSIVKRLPTHSGKLERVVDRGHLETVSRAMRDWYGPDIPLASARGVVVRKGGEFYGPAPGSFMSFVERGVDMTRRIARGARLSMGAGFAGYPELLSEMKIPHKTRMMLSMIGSSQSNTNRWNDGFAFAIPSGAAPGGTAFVDSSDTDFPTFINPESGDTQHLLRVTGVHDVAGLIGSVLIYDRLFGVTKTMNSTATETVTGVPTRYQNTAAGNDDYIGGNFVFPNQRNNIGTTAHNHNVCTYTDESGAASTMPSVAGSTANQQNIIDLADTWRWFMPLEAGDVGIGALTQIQLDALVASGAIDYIIGHPLAWFYRVERLYSIIEGVNNCLYLNRIFDDAALSFIHINAASSGGQPGRVYVDTVIS